jgi:hypothetical protein
MASISNAAIPPIKNAINIHRFRRVYVFGRASMWLAGSIWGNIRGELFEPGEERLESAYDEEFRCTTPEAGLGIGRHITPV